MQMRVQVELLSPRMQDGEEADLGFQVFPTDGRLQQRGGRGLEQEIVDQLFILQRQRAELVGQGEDDMNIPRAVGPLSIFEPLGTQAGLAFGGSGDWQGVVGLLPMPALITLTRGRPTALCDRRQGLEHQRVQGCRSRQTGLKGRSIAAKYQQLRRRVGT
jgi:hypothetical protein